MIKKHSFGPNPNKSKGTWNLTSDKPITVRDLQKVTEKPQTSLYGMKVVENKHMPNNYMCIVNSKGDMQQIIKIGNRKVLFKLWRFELAYYQKEDL